MIILECSFLISLWGGWLLAVLKQELGWLLHVRWFALNKCVIVVRIIIDWSMEGRAAVMEVWIIVVTRHPTAEGFLGREDHLMLFVCGRDTTEGYLFCWICQISMHYLFS